MDSNEIRKKYLEFFEAHGHAVIPRAPMVPENDPTTLFTGSGMQPLVNYFLGDPHPAGQRIVDSQTCFRAEDVDEVGDNRHTTFFEMLGNWSFGDYFKAEQLPWFFEFLTDEIGIDPNRLYVTCFIGDENAGVGKDEESAQVWQKLFDSRGIDNKIVEIGSESDGYASGMQNGRIFYYDSSKNWWSRSGKPDEMPAGEPGGPDSEVFYEFTEIEHDKKYGEHCHPNCDCGRFLEIGNSVFMEFVKQEDGGFRELPNKNVDFGGGLERISAASLNSPDVFKISLIWPVIEKLQEISGHKYEDNMQAMRVIADHLRAGIFLATDGVVPSNKRQGYVMRRLLRRAIRYALDLGIEQGVCERLAPIIAELYRNDFPEVLEREQEIIDVLKREEKVFRQTLRSGIKKIERMKKPGLDLTGRDVFVLYDTYGFPAELAIEEAHKQGIKVHDSWKEIFDKNMEEQKARSRTAAAGEFKGGLADAGEMPTKLHPAAHLLDEGFRRVLGDHVIQRGSNITAERLRYDFSHPEKMTPDQITEVEKIVNEAIEKDYPVSWTEENTEQALGSGAIGAFGHKYGDKVKVYTIGDQSSPFNREICGGPHVEHTGQLGEGGKKFKVKKEESSSAGVRRIKAVLE
jgi:alanyl-tRNA synthetase